MTNGGYGRNGFYLDTATNPVNSLPLAQEEDADYGKLVRIDLETGSAKHVSSGHRNPQGLAIDDQERIWVLEHGPRGGDELNRIVEGQNYGWPLESYGTAYSMDKLPTAETLGRHERYAKPAYAWVPSIGTSRLHYLNGFDPAWDGDFLAGGLNSRMLYHIRTDGDRVVYAEPIKFGYQVRDIKQLKDGRVAIWDGKNYLLLLTPVPVNHHMNAIREYIDKMDVPDEKRAAIQSAINRCAECHSFTPDKHHRGPSLAGIFDAPVAGTSFRRYSETLSNKGGTWTADKLHQFLADPTKAVPGTEMPNPNIADPAVIDGLVEVLKAQKDFN